MGGGPACVSVTPTCRPIARAAPPATPPLSSARRRCHLRRVVKKKKKKHKHHRERPVKRTMTRQPRTKTVQRRRTGTPHCCSGLSNGGTKKKSQASTPTGQTQARRVSGSPNATPKARQRPEEPTYADCSTNADLAACRAAPLRQTADTRNDRPPPHHVRSVADHVHWETITDAERPVLTDRPAVLKYSEVITCVRVRAGARGAARRCRRGGRARTHTKKKKHRHRRTQRTLVPVSPLPPSVRAP